MLLRFVVIEFLRRKKPPSGSMAEEKNIPQFMDWGMLRLPVELVWDEGGDFDELAVLAGITFGSHRC